jgi:hypothetical protein
MFIHRIARFGAWSLQDFEGVLQPALRYSRASRGVGTPQVGARRLGAAGQLVANGYPIMLRRRIGRDLNVLSDVSAPPRAAGLLDHHQEGAYNPSLTPR